MMIIGLWILIWLLTVLLSNCTLGPTEAPAPAPVPAARSTVVSRRPATFTESYRWVDGLAVEVVEVNSRKTPGFDAGGLPDRTGRRFVQ
jgi:hypothetical protein